LADLKNLEQGNIYLLKAPFLTAPIIDKATSIGILHWIEKVSEEEFLIYFTSL